MQSNSGFLDILKKLKPPQNPFLDNLFDKGLDSRNQEILCKNQEYLQKSGNGVQEEN